MNAYDRECEDMDALGALVVTPGAMLAEMNTIDATVRQLDIEIMSSVVNVEFKDAWRRFVAEWQVFHQNHEDWWDRTWGVIYDKVLDYRRRVEEWRGQFHRAGGHSVSPPLPAAPGGPPVAWNKLYWLAAALVGTWALTSVASTVGRARAVARITTGAVA